jgi:hypothetical protein
MIDPYDFEDDDFEISEEDFILPTPVSKMTEGEKLQRFKRFFDSSTRAILQDCLFRIVNHEDDTGTLEILCPNEAVRQRLSKKKRKITNNINGCWPHILWFSLCIQQDGQLDCQTFTLNGDLVTP